jgi:hypothetical protein
VELASLSADIIHKNMGLWPRRPGGTDLASEALFGFVGVVLGSVTTSVLTIYQERVVGRRESAVREQQYEQDRKASRDTFQRDSILALQSAVMDMIKTVHGELDRILAEVQHSGEWPARQWETPTATGWSEAVLRLESSRARVFDDELRSLATELRIAAGDSVWARDLESARQASERLEPLQIRFHEAVTRVLPDLY